MAGAEKMGGFCSRRQSEKEWGGPDVIGHYRPL